MRPVRDPERRSWLGRLARLTLVVLFLGAIAAALAYVRLLNGPISMHVLAAPIAAALGEELGGLTAHVADVQVRIAETGRLEFGLRDIDVRDTDGSPLISAPWAAVTLAPRALLRLRIAPEAIALVAPRLNVFYADDGTLSLRFLGHADAAEGEPAAATRDREASRPVRDPVTPGAGAPAAAIELRRIDLVKALADASARARRQEASSAFLQRVGLRDARIIVEQGRRRSVWNVPELQIGFDHRAARSTITGSATIASTSGPWKISLGTYEHEDADKLDLRIGLENLVPKGIARIAPGLAVLEGFDLPLTGEATLEVARSGDIRSGAMQLKIGAGHIATPWLGEVPLDVDTGTLDLVYDGSQRRFLIKTFDLAWQSNRLGLGGTVDYRLRNGAEGPRWIYELASKSGELAADRRDAPPLPLGMTASGHWSPEDGRVTLARFALRAGSAEVQAEGDAADLTGQPRARLDGRISPMPVAQLRAIWPQSLAPAARAWAIRNLTKGQIHGGTFRLATADGGSAQPNQPDAGPTLARVTLALEASGLEAALAKGAPVLEIPRALLRIEGASLEITAPDAALALPDGRRVALKANRLTAVDLASDRPMAELSLKAQGPLATLADMLDREPLGLLRSNGLVLTGLEGKADGQFKAVFPLIADLAFADLRFDGKARIIDGRLRQVAGAYDITGATFTVDASEKAVDVKGEMLIKGVLARLAWQYVQGAPAERQPPIRITTTLDDSDRTQFGLDVNDIVQGEVPVEITVSREAGRTEPLVRVRADLTRAEMTIDEIAWSKPKGRAATYQFDFVRNQQGGQQGRAELQNVKLVGDTIAVEGWMAIGADNKLREFYYPEFSVNVVSRLEVQGKLRPDRVWEVRAKGATFDGRDLFRQMFALDAPNRPPPPKDKPGLDLVAEIDTVIGFSETPLKGVRIKAQRRAERLIGLDLRGTHEGGRPFEAEIQVVQAAGGPARRLRAESADAGRTFKMVGFYPNAVGGHMNLEVNLDARGVAEKTGTLWVRDFAVLGDPIVSEVVQIADPNQPQIGRAQRAKTRIVRQQFDFDRFQAPFSIGYGQFVLENAALGGPLIGATLRGKVDFKKQTVNIGGTYIPLSGLNSAIGAIPILGQLLAGVQGEGVFGITFLITGPMAQPQVIVNPLSLVTPGILRSLMEMLQYDQQVQARDDKPASVPPKKADPARASSTTQPPPADAGPKRARTAAPEVGGSWTSDTRIDPAKRN